MYKSLIFLLLFFVSCSNSSEEISEPVEPIETTASVESTTTTTASAESTTTTTASAESTTTTIVEIKLPEISLNNCPSSIIEDDNYDLLWSITAGDFDVDYVRISYWINGEYFSRVYYEKSQLNDTFPFPVAEEKIVYTQNLDFTDIEDYETLDVYFSISDESDSFSEIEKKCSFLFNNTPLVSTTTTTTTSTTNTSTTTTTTIPSSTTTTTTVPPTTTTTFPCNLPNMYSTPGMGMEPYQPSRVNDSEGNFSHYSQITFAFSTSGANISGFKVYQNSSLYFTGMSANGWKDDGVWGPGTYVWEITAYNDCGETDVLATRTWVINSSGGGDF